MIVRIHYNNLKISISVLKHKKEALIPQGFFYFYLDPQLIRDSYLNEAYSYWNGACPKITEKNGHEFGHGIAQNLHTKNFPRENRTGSHGGRFILRQQVAASIHCHYVILV